MSFNVFDWIRESVKRSVIQGVSEALEVIGADDDARSRPRAAISRECRPVLGREWRNQAQAAGPLATRGGWRRRNWPCGLAGTLALAA